jgi:predicted adenine nucleotide alpha hydrolase (AANH) superfamily ATPase
MTEKKIDYNLEFKNFLKGLDLSKGKSKLFLHACCGPCLTYPLSVLSEYFEVTVGYINPNIYPEAEHQKRLDELKRFVSAFNKDKGTDVQVISFPYDYQDYLKAVKGHESDKEGGERCTLCHSLRLSESFEYAAQHGFPYFTTVMTVSSHKPSALLNEIGEDLQKKYPETKFICADFKKEDGQLKGIKIAKAYSLYRQNYCGCSFSLKEREEKEGGLQKNDNILQG